MESAAADIENLRRSGGGYGHDGGLVPWLRLVHKRRMGKGLKWMEKLVRGAVDYALPPRCPSCGVMVEADDRFCLPCWSKLDFLGPPWCARCQMPLDDAALDGDWCASCLAQEPPYDRVSAVVAYTPQSGALVLKLKYGRRTGLARLIATHMLRHVPQDSDEGEGGGEWLLVPVPLHPMRLWERGFNQSLLIARHLGKRTGFTVMPDLLRRTKRTRPLKGLNPAQRDKEVRAVFALTPDGKAQVNGRRILLVDDVFTSGATARACARKLKQAGAAEVRIFCWARVVPRRAALDLALPDSDMRADKERGWRASKTFKE